MRRHFSNVSHSFLVSASIVILTFWSLACAARASRPRGDAASELKARVEAYWKRREAKDLVGAYPFYCSAYKKRVPQAEFLRLTRLTRFDIQETRVEPIAATADRVQVTVSYRFLMPTISPQPLESKTTDWWARETDGQWCKEDEPLIVPSRQSPASW